ncbi:MAG: chemotaxis protein CheW [Nitrospirota bacterium]|nr:chemotaxis protein CheW [Nitrospirota bacterium]
METAKSGVVPSRNQSELARELAQEVATTPGVADFGDGVLQLVSFQLGEEEYALDVLSVREINRTSDVTRVPKAPYFVEGVMNLRGKILPVVNLRKRFGFPQANTADDEARTIVVFHEGLMVGLAVDQVYQVIRIPRDKIEKNEGIGLGNVLDAVMAGVAHLGDRMVVLLDLPKLLEAIEKDAGRR